MNYLNKTPIKIKKKLCSVCGGLEPIFSHKRCKPCALKQDAEKKKKEEVAKEQKEESKTKSSSQIKRTPKTKNKDLATFFEHHIENLYKIRQSEESGTPIPYPSNVNICHLFPKRNHKSVAANDTNCIYLTLDEHTKLDNKYLDRHDFAGLQKDFPNSFKLIIERMRVVRVDITERTNFVESFDKFNETLDF